MPLKLLKFSICFFLFYTNIYAHIISGKVTDEYGYSIKDVKVELMNNTKIISSTSTNKNGIFKLQTNVSKNITIRFSNENFIPLTKQITLKKNVFLGEIILKFKELSYLIDAVSIKVLKKSSTLKKSPLSVSSIDTKSIIKKAINSADLISEISGVNVTRESGLGSATNYSINGMNGKQVRFFIDDIPIEYYGTNLNVSAIPITFFERVDVYKGVIPIHLGADALGGSVNLISNNTKKKEFNFNYNIGSFNTHLLSLNMMHKFKHDTYFNLNTFYNHSDNNYKMKNATIIDKNGRVSKKTVKRFHNKFDNWFMKGQIGIRNKEWIDHGFISLYATDNKYEVQNNKLGDQVFGNVYKTNLSLGTLLKYEKKELIKNINVNLFSVYKKSYPHFYDLSNNLYNWNGDIIYKREQPNLGEMSTLGIDNYTKNTSFLGQFNISWNINETMNLNSVYQQSYLFRKGKDKIAQKNNFDDLLENPTKYSKSILALSLEKKLLKNKISSITFIKKYNFKSKGFERENRYYGKIKNIITSQNELGYGQALSYKANKKITLKASYEYSLRIPSPEEIYGNLGGIISNSTLKAERSSNANLGAYYKYNNISFETNVFFRNPKNLIFLKTSKFFSQYQNISKAMIVGFDTEISLKLSNKINTTANITWQNIKNKSLVGNSKKYINQRLPNRPYLFGNFNLNYNINPKLKLWYGIRYVKSFFLSWENDGLKDLKNIIPSQFPSQCGFNLITSNNKYSMSFECTNIFDQLTYDKFKLQKPGRAFYITLNYKK